MNAPLWALETAAAFWRAAGRPPSYPRDLRRSIAWGLPLTLVALPRPRVADVFDWLEGQAISCRIPAPDRPLRACLIASRGEGVIVIDGSDREDEQRFSMAHETAHFLRHYLEPRRRAVERLGSSILRVLDGDRPPTSDERLLSVLAHAPIGTQVHMMERDRDGEPTTPEVRRAEQEADRLAFELLAPIESVNRAIAAFSTSDRLDGATAILQDVYGLPAVQAAQYASLLAPPLPDSQTRRWGFA